MLLKNRDAILRSSLLPLLRIGTFALLAAGLVALVVLWRPDWGGWLLAGAALLWLARRWAKRRQQAALKAVLYQEPVYQQLLNQYPSAVVKIGLEREGK